jgi:hypothetical protein
MSPRWKAWRGRAEAVSVAASSEEPAVGKDAGPATLLPAGTSLPCLMCGWRRVLGWGLPHVVGPCGGCFDAPYPSTEDGRRLAVALAERGPW